MDTGKIPGVKTVKVKLWGIVQGVGFRPFVAKLADRFDMKGEILNIGGLVDIVITDTQERTEAFIEALKREKPAPAEIVHIKIEEMEPRSFDAFTIRESDEGDDEAAMIPADLSICPDCLAELQDPGNPRYKHPFISCMVCGPRYTIIDEIPYDRENTTMDEFTMCEFCHGEYVDRKDRRYHAQTISCHSCGPMLECRVSGNSGKIRSVSDKDPVARAVMLLEEGKIIAVKGVGGYNLVCSPYDEDAVKNLRRLKGREEKPFAVMFCDVEQIRETCHVGREEEALLQSNARPIVLLERKKAVSGGREICRETYRTSRYLGAFLPSMGVQFLLVSQFGPLIVTSANLSDLPIIKDDEEMFRLQDSMELLSAVFYNQRKIRVRVDDSVARVMNGQPQMIRRSKGYAPVPLYIDAGLEKSDMIFAAGGQLKASFALSKGNFSYISQYLGDLDSREAGEIYMENVGRMEDLFRIRPELAVCDLHPLYFTTKYGEEYAKTRGIGLLKVQHHHAHVASVMAEHHLEGPVIGVSFDGTGYGTDGAIWGGEFLICRDEEFRRAGHLEYIKMLGGDSSMKEGWKSAFSYLYHYGKEPEDTRWATVKSALAHNINTINSSSMGRLFDAVAAFGGIHDVNRYEGECAVMLENAAAEALENVLEPWEMEFGVEENGPETIISAREIFRRTEEGALAGIEGPRIALGFHYAVARMIVRVCKSIRERKGIDTVALSGGVFQNKILMDRTLALLRAEGFSSFCNISVSPNDGGICLGQNYIGMKYLTKKQHKDMEKGLYSAR